jgi:putative protein kinase ArgK-like GTPase of G3E family
VLLTSATGGQGIPELLDALEDLVATRQHLWSGRRRRALAVEVREAVVEEARARLEERLAEADAEADLERVLRGELSISELASALLERARPGTE